uniref:Putative secreted protein n=1 Tax=Panstrongylus lignarius TaxID=156445 RepID=A0A224XZ46_9HEMI
MISPKMLFTLLVLIYVTLSHEEVPEIETFSLEEAKSELKKLVDETLDKISNYGEEVKRKLKEWKDSYAKGGNLEENIQDLELILNNSITNYFKEKKTSLNKKLVNLAKGKLDNVKGSFEQFYEDSKILLEGAEKYWKKQWNAATNLLKSAV